jgi:hypothetical protein
VALAMMAILVVALVATVLYIVAMGIRQRRQARTLARLTAELSLRFSRDDPLELPEALSEFSLVAGGHSARASHVAYGRLDEMDVAAFNFRYEVGHGTRRLTRHYSMFLARVGHDLPPVVMWNTRDPDVTPVDMHRVDQHVAGWACTGSRILADIVKDTAGELAGKGLSVEVRHRQMLLALPGRQSAWWNYTTWLQPAREVVGSLATGDELAGPPALSDGYDPVAG